MIANIFCCIFGRNAMFGMGNKPAFTVVTLRSYLGQLSKTGNWITLNCVVKEGSTIIIAQPDEPAQKGRPCAVVKQTGFRHKIVPLDKRHRRGYLRHGSKLIVYFR